MPSVASSCIWKLTSEEEGEETSSGLLFVGTRQCFRDVGFACLLTVDHLKFMILIESNGKN